MNLHFKSFLIGASLLSVASPENCMGMHNWNQRREFPSVGEINSHRMIQITHDQLRDLQNGNNITTFDGRTITFTEKLNNTDFAELMKANMIMLQPSGVRRGYSSTTINGQTTQNSFSTPQTWTLMAMDNNYTVDITSRIHFLNK